MSRNRLHVRFDEKSIDKIFRDLNTSHMPGAAVGVAIGGAPVYRKGFGLANMELPVTLTPQTRMRIYSMTKHFTCLAYLLLCEKGKAEVDDTIGKYLPALHPVTRHATMRQLMGNTSGLRDACEIRWFFSGIDGTVPASELLDLYRDIEDVNFKPGEAWCYNNGGFNILSAVIEKITDLPLEEVFRRHIFEPVGMYDTLLRRVDTNFVVNSAAMHMEATGGGYERRYLPGELLGEGGLVSTVDDILRWLNHMKTPTVGDSNTWSLMLSSQKLRDCRETGYGLGLVLGSFAGLDTISHSGGGLGNNSQMVRMPAGDLDVVVIANRHDFNACDLAAGILSACIGVSTELSRHEACHVDGVFCSPATGRVIQMFTKDCEQMAVIDGVEELPLKVRDGRVLRSGLLSSSNVSITLHGDSSVQYECFGGVDTLARVQNESSTDIEPIAGDFRADPMGVRMKVEADERAGRAVTVGRFGSRAYTLERVCGRLWRMVAADGTGWGGILATDADGGGATFRTTRTWGVRFVREKR